MFAIEQGSTGPALRAWAQSLPVKPTGIVIMSPHWMARSPQVMTTAKPQTWHDFGGFPEPLYQLQYPAVGDPALAQRVLALLQTAGISAQPDAQRPFDHGAWVPLMHLFPAADIPVVQVALPANYTPQSLMAMGAALQSLRNEGVLIIGSGSMTHNLGEFFNNGRPELDAAPAQYVGEFSRWLEDHITQRDTQALLHYRSQAPHAVRAHPTDEHLVSIFFALGAAGWGSDAGVKAHYLSREVMYSILAMDAFALT
jgi:4,5-DOPA dioxygenase extradiol